MAQPNNTTAQILKKLTDIETIVTKLVGDLAENKNLTGTLVNEMAEQKKESRATALQIAAIVNDISSMRMQGPATRNVKKTTTSSGTSGSEAAKKPEYKSFAKWVADKVKEDFDTIIEIVGEKKINDIKEETASNKIYKGKTDNALKPVWASAINAKFLTEGNKGFDSEMFAKISELYEADKKAYLEA